jgi:hypothetical protein
MVYFLQDRLQFNQFTRKSQRPAPVKGMGVKQRRIVREINAA